MSSSTAQCQTHGLIARSAAKWLWCGDHTEFCYACGHHLEKHSTNSSPERGHCLEHGCRCVYFSPLHRNDYAKEVVP